MPVLSGCWNITISTYTEIIVLFLLSSLTCVEKLHALEETIHSDRIIKAHNLLRAEVGVTGLSWSKQLEEKAIDWANVLKRFEGCSMAHSGPGENLYWASALKVSHRKNRHNKWILERSVQKISEQKVVDSWASEKKWYDYQSNNCSAPDGKTCGHYTQVVWGNSTEVGCGKVICEDKSQIWVCNYSPVGNILGQKPY